MQSSDTHQYQRVKTHLPEYLPVHIGDLELSGAMLRRWRSLTGSNMHGIGIIGLGIMGRRVAEAMQAHPKFRVTAGFDPHPPSDLAGIPLRDDAAAVIHDPSVDCVYIASPPASHASLVTEAAMAGKAIFCEKPLAANVAEARSCVHLVHASRVAAAVNFPFASAPSAVKLHEMAIEGRLGDLEAAKLTLRFARWPRGWQADASGWLAGAQQGGFTREVISHFLFIANRIFGAGVLCDTRIARGPAGTETSVSAVVRYHNATLTIDAAVAGDVEDYNRFEVFGSHNKAALTNWYCLEADGSLSDRTLPMPYQLDSLAQMLTGDTSHSLATFEEAAAVVDLVEGVLARPPGSAN